MRARGRGMTWWARTAQKSGSRLLPNAAVGVWLRKVFKKRAMAPGENLAPEAPCLNSEEAQVLRSGGQHRSSGAVPAHPARYIHQLTP